MELDFRGVSREELDANKEEEQFLVGMKKATTCKAGMLKRGINPYGSVCHCEFAMHPQNARVLPYSLVRIGNLKEKTFGQILHRAKGFYPLLCAFCQQHEYGMNIAFAKLSEDCAQGISIAQQPYYDKTDVVIVGMGRWGAGSTVAALDKVLGEESHIYAVAGSNYAEIKERFSNNRRVSILERNRLDSILARKEIKAVFVTTQFRHHYEAVRKALLAGKHVFVEKPFVETKEQEQELINLAKDRGLMLAVGYAYMNEYDFFKLRRLIQRGLLGKIERVELTMLNSVAGRKLDKSSNVIEDLVVHQVSMLMMMFGDRTVEEIKVHLRGEEAKATFTYGDIEVYIHVDRDFREENRVRRVEVFGDKADIILDYSKFPVEFAVHKSGERVEKGDAGYHKLLSKSDDKLFLEAEFRVFFEAIRTGKTPINSADSTRTIMSTTERLNRPVSNYGPQQPKDPAKPLMQLTDTPENAQAKIEELKKQIKGKQNVSSLRGKHTPEDVADYRDRIERAEEEGRVQDITQDEITQQVKALLEGVVVELPQGYGKLDILETLAAKQIWWISEPQRGPPDGFTERDNIYLFLHQDDLTTLELAKDLLHEVIEAYLINQGMSAKEAWQKIR